MQCINDKTGSCIDFEDVNPEQIFVGNILTLHDEGGDHHFQVKSMGGFPNEPAHVIPAKSNLFQVGILLGSLAATWFVLDWAFSNLL